MNRNEPVSDLLSAPGAFPNCGEAVKRVPDGMCRRSESACRPADAIVVPWLMCAPVGLAFYDAVVGSERCEESVVRGSFGFLAAATCSCGILKPV
jgi:hypothetical protein